ncbi:MAG: DNA-directed RNA polymerase [Candidatus Bathyarchaeota archaeon]|nr:DNA-directed RNA polymerase [Candidatus Bathyarchaeota archaeon]
MHKVVCAECGEDCEVPFKPDGRKPVYCRDCYSKRRPQRRRY